MKEVNSSYTANSTYYRKKLKKSYIHVYLMQEDLILLSMLPKPIYRFTAVSIQIPTAFLKKCNTQGFMEFQ